MTRSQLFSGVLNRGKRFGAAWLASGLAGVCLTAAPALAGGGGENMFLVVNPNDEASIRIATAYQQLRNIPDSNIFFVTPAPLKAGFNPILVKDSSQFLDTYVTPVAAAINDRGLNGQIDYIATVGMPASFQTTVQVNPSYSYTATYSTSFALSRLTDLNNGADISQTAGQMSSLYQGTPGSAWTYAQGDNNAIHHSQSYGGKQYYLSGMVGYTGTFGNTPDQIISNLERTVAGDGTKPTGTVYFEENSDIRTTTRSGKWPEVQAALAARGINYVQESGVTPQNKTDVRGAVVGKSTLTLPNGSTYLPGSWADNLTSYGAEFNTANQTKATGFIAAGAGGTSGTVIEPGAVAWKFPDGSIHVFNADGSTLGEAYAKSVNLPQQTTFIGDLQAQAYADLPVVSLTAAPSNGSTVSGNISLDASASLTNPTLATGIGNLRLWVDGKAVGSAINGDSGTFNLDTTALSDGRHELRVVAINNAATESENAVILHVNVDNHGQSVQANSGNNLSAAAKQILSIPVSAVAGSVTLNRVELRSLGRNLGQITSASGNISLDASNLAYGANTVTPVAVLSDGTEVAGAPITVTRNPTYLGGASPTPAAYRAPGIKAEYFLGQGGKSIAASSYSGTPDITQTVGGISLRNSVSTQLDTSSPLLLPTTDIDKLAARFSGFFDVSADNAGEYLFSLYRTNDSARLSIDGTPVVTYDNYDYVLSWYNDTSGSVFLSPGQHYFELLTANTMSSESDTRFDVAAYMRGPDGITHLLDNGILYQAVPEPGTMAFFMLGTVGLLLKRRKR